MSSTPCISTQETTQDLATPRPWRLGQIGDVGYSDSVAPCHIWTEKGPGHGMVATTAPWCQPGDQQRADAAFIVEAVNAYDSNKALIEQLYAKLTCCCGDYMDHSAMGAGHSPVSMYDHALGGAERRIAELEAAASVPAQRAPTPDLTKALTEFSDFINEPPQYEDKRMVRDYRHELARKWVPLLEQLLALTSTERGREVHEEGSLCSDCPPLGDEYDGTRCLPCPRRRLAPAVSSTERRRCECGVGLCTHRPDCRAK